MWKILKKLCDGELVAANYVSILYVYILIHKIQAVWGVISDLLNQWVRMGGTVSKKFDRDSVDEVLNGFSINNV